MTYDERTLLYIQGFRELFHSRAAADFFDTPHQASCFRSAESSCLDFFLSSPPVPQRHLLTLPPSKLDSLSSLVYVYPMPLLISFLLHHMFIIHIYILVYQFHSVEIWKIGAGKSVPTVKELLRKRVVFL